MDKMKRRMFNAEELAELDKEGQRFLESCNQENIMSILITAAVNQTVVLPAILERLVVALEHFIDLKLGDDTETQSSPPCQNASLDEQTMKSQDDHLLFPAQALEENVPL